MRRGPGVPDGKPVRSVRAVQPRHGHASDGDGDGVDAVRGVRGDDAVSSRRDARAVRAVRDGEREPAGGGEREARVDAGSVRFVRARRASVGERARYGVRAVRWVSVDVGVRGGVDGCAVRGVRDGDEDAFFGDASGGGDVRWRHGASESPGGETYARELSSD